MNKIVTNSGCRSLPEGHWPMECAADHIVQGSQLSPERFAELCQAEIAPGFDGAIITVNAKPPQHDWSQANSKLSELREEFAGMEPVTFRATLAIEGEVSWNLNIPKMPRNDARELRRLVQNYLADLSLTLERKITVKGNASTLPVGEP